MTQLERKEKIDANNKLIQEILNPSQFTLNNVVRDLLEENAQLQRECEHSFVDGYCEYCYLEDPNNE
jgi:hypothetical protein